MSSPVAKFAATVVAALGLLWTTSAEAHTHLIGATPPEDVASPTPKLVRLEFSAPLQPMFSGFEVVGADGTTVLEKGAVDKANKKLMSVRRYWQAWDVREERSGVAVYAEPGTFPQILNWAVDTMLKDARRCSIN